MAEGRQYPIVYRQSDRLVVGEHPKGGVGPANRIATLNADEYAKLLRTDPAYLAIDGDHIQGTPP